MLWSYSVDRSREVGRPLCSQRRPWHSASRPQVETYGRAIRARKLLWKSIVSAGRWRGQDQVAVLLSSDAPWCTCPGSPPPRGVASPKYLCLLLTGSSVNYACVRSRSPRPMSPLQDAAEERVPIHDGQDRRPGRWQFEATEMTVLPPGPSPVYAFTPVERLFVTASRRFTAQRAKSNSRLQKPRGRAEQAGVM